MLSDVTRLLLSVTFYYYYYQHCFRNQSCLNTGHGRTRTINRRHKYNCKQFSQSILGNAEATSNVSININGNVFSFNPPISRKRPGARRWEVCDLLIFGMVDAQNELQSRACLTCKKSKVRCDRWKPKCSR